MNNKLRDINLIAFFLFFFFASLLYYYSLEAIDFFIQFS